LSRKERSASVGRASTAAPHSEDPIATIERWCDAGADYRVVHLSDEQAVVDLTTCDGSRWSDSSRANGG
jgi:hypothetical protein